MRKIILISILILICSGCRTHSSNQSEIRQDVKTLQEAVDAYYQQTSLLPIQTAAQDVPKFEKFKINFQPLLANHHLFDIPSTSFEKGGEIQYLIVDETSKPKVRALDLNKSQQVQKIQQKIKRNDYTFKEDYPGLSLLKEEVPSVFSQEPLPLMTAVSGKIYIDYAKDLMQLIERKKIPEDELKKMSDLRDLLIDASFYVPIYSLPYRWIDSRPQPIVNG